MNLMKKLNNYLINNWVPAPKYRDKVDRIISYIWSANLFLMGMIFMLALFTSTHN